MTQPLGNSEAKYDARNPIARRLVAGFLDTVAGLIRAVRPASILEVGCGEGRLATELLARIEPPARFEIGDRSLAALPRDLDPRLSARQADVYALPHDDRSVDLVLCCEVLEHLEAPRTALFELARVARRAVILSTPREPLWRALNLARGRYVGALGNTPGHVQHFSRRGLVELVGLALDPVAVRTPIPWTVVLARPRAPAAHSPARTSK